MPCKIRNAFIGLKAARMIRSEPLQEEDAAPAELRNELLRSARAALERLVKQGDDREAVTW